MAREEKPLILKYLLMMLVIAAIAGAVLLISSIISGVIGIRANTEDATVCEQNGFVWLSGAGVSDPGCYHLERIEIE